MAQQMRLRVLSRGLLSGHWFTKRQPQDFRSSLPRFQGERLEQNLALVEKLKAFATARGITVAQVAIAWVLTRGTDIVPLIGARQRERLAEALKANSVVLTPEDLSEIERLIPIGAGAGDRYNTYGMDSLDSER
jgi:aryl-alcohol dehydrogenase-like predicted oxidoreductase